NRNHTAAHRREARAIRLRRGGGDRVRDGARVAGDPAARQCAAMVERAPHGTRAQLIMAGATQTLTLPRFAATRPATEESRAVQWLLIAIVLLFFAAFLLLPLAMVFVEAFRKGMRVYFETLRDPDTVAAIWLTLKTAAIAVPLNTTFGLAAAWAIARFQFPGKRLLTNLIDLPLWISPVIGGLIYVLLFGSQGWFGDWLIGHDIKIIFAQPGIVLATIFVTFPFVARGLIPLMQSQGQLEEEAALTLGASGWQVFRRV